METFKLTLMCLAASFLTVSCTETTDLNHYDYEANGIQFATISDIPQSRGLPISSANTIPNMGVFAYYTGNGTANNWGAKGTTATPNFMDNIEITNTGVPPARKVYLLSPLYLSPFFFSFCILFFRSKRDCRKWYHNERDFRHPFH